MNTHLSIVLSQRVRGIIRTQGLLSLIRRAFLFIIRWLFTYERYDLYEGTIGEILKLDETEILPRTQAFTLRVISSNKEADNLEAQGFEFRSYIPGAVERLDKGAMAFCIFVGHELANMGWLAFTKEANQTIWDSPFGADFSNDESVTGGSFTNPKYRAMGMMTYNLYKRLEFANEQGKLRDRAIMRKSNIAPQILAAKFGYRVYAEMHFIRIVGCKIWKMKPRIR